MDQFTAYNSLFLQIVETFSKFLTSGGHDTRYTTDRCPSSYINIMNMDIQLTAHLMSKNARTFILHLVGDACTCTFCLQVDRLVAQNVISSAPPTISIPVDFTASCGNYHVTHLHAAQVRRLMEVMSVIPTRNAKQEEIRRYLYTLLASALH